jgi:hypothetical protein
MSVSTHSLALILGHDAGVLGLVLDDIIPTLDGVQYRFLDPPTFQSLPPPEMNHSVCAPTYIMRVCESPCARPLGRRSLGAIR